MQLDLTKYRHCMDTFKHVLNKNTADYESAISTFSSSYGIPVLVLYFYAEEILGPKDFIEKNKKLLTEFYGYDEIIKGDK